MRLTIEGKELTLTQHPLLKSYGDRECYFAQAINSNGDEYLVRWDIHGHFEKCTSTNGTKEMSMNEFEQEKEVSEKEPGLSGIIAPIVLILAALIFYFI